MNKTLYMIPAGRAYRQHGNITRSKEIYVAGRGVYLHGHQYADAIRCLCWRKWCNIGYPRSAGSQVTGGGGGGSGSGTNDGGDGSVTDGKGADGQNGNSAGLGGDPECR